MTWIETEGSGLRNAYAGLMISHVPADKTHKRTIHQAARTEDLEYPEKAKTETKKTMQPASLAAGH